MVIFFPSIQPSLLSSCRNASKRTALPEEVLLSRKPMRGTFPVCCASTVEHGARSGEHRARKKIFLVIGVGPALFSNLRPLTSDLRLLLLDHFISSRQDIRWNGQADLLRRFQVDDKLKLRRLLDWEIGWVSTFQDLVHIRSGASGEVVDVRAIAHKPTLFDEFLKVVCRWQPVLYCKFDNLCSVRNEHGASEHEDCVGMPLACGSEYSLNILGTLYI